MTSSALSTPPHCGMNNMEWWFRRSRAMPSPAAFVLRCPIRSGGNRRHTDLTATYQRRRAHKQNRMHATEAIVRETKASSCRRSVALLHRQRAPVQQCDAQQPGLGVELHSSDGAAHLFQSPPEAKAAWVRRLLPKLPLACNRCPLLLLEGSRPAQASAIRARPWS